MLDLSRLNASSELFKGGQWDEDHWTMQTCREVLMGRWVHLDERQMLERASREGWQKTELENFLPEQYRGTRPAAHIYCRIAPHIRPELRYFGNPDMEENRELARGLMNCHGSTPLTQHRAWVRVLILALGQKLEGTPNPSFESFHGVKEPSAQCTVFEAAKRRRTDDPTALSEEVRKAIEDRKDANAWKKEGKKGVRRSQEWGGARGSQKRKWGW